MQLHWFAHLINPKLVNMHTLLFLLVNQSSSSFMPNAREVVDHFLL